MSRLKALSSQVTIGVLLQFANDATIIGTAVLLFPVFKGYGEGMALLFSRLFSRARHYPARHFPGGRGAGLLNA